MADTALGAHVQRLAEEELKHVHALIQRLLMAELLAAVSALRRAILKPVQSTAGTALGAHAQQLAEAELKHAHAPIQRLLMAVLLAAV